MLNIYSFSGSPWPLLATHLIRPPKPREAPPELPFSLTSATDNYPNNENETICVVQKLVGGSMQTHRCNYFGYPIACVRGYGISYLEHTPIISVRLNQEIN